VGGAKAIAGSAVALGDARWNVLFERDDLLMQLRQAGIGAPLALYGF